MLATMSQHAEIPPLSWSSSALLPTGTVTLLLADVEGSTRLWEANPEQMTAALALLNRTVDEVVPAYGGLRPVEQGEGDSFVAAFARASDAVSCAVALQRALLAPIRIRIGLHTGEIQLRDEGNYAGPTINRAARIRDLAHGGQTVLSGVTESLVMDRLPDGVWLTDLGSYPLKGVPRPERVVQLCHPDLCNKFPPLRVHSATTAANLPVQLTSFVGRQAQMTELPQLITANRLVTLTGAGGAGKTRLAVELAAQLTAEFADGVWYVDLAPITNPAVVPVSTARALGLPDQPGRSTTELLVRFFGEKSILLLLDNCEHLLDACGTMIVELLKSCPCLTILTTSREPLGLPGELSWRVPSLSLQDEAIELFADRARRVRPGFVVDEGNTVLVRQICERLDGMPLAIELAAARVRALSLKQIADSLHDRFRLLTGGARTAVRRQQTLRSSVDWSHALLTEPEQVLFRRLAVFAGGFDLDAAHSVGAGSEIERYQLMDQLGLLVDKSLVVADDTSDGMRYHLLETVRQYAQEKLGESGESNAVRARHRDYYTATAFELHSRGRAGIETLMSWVNIEIDNLRAAFVWSRENSDPEMAVGLASSLQQYWLRCGSFREALAGFDSILTEQGPDTISPSVWARAVADHTTLGAWIAAPTSAERAQAALVVARQVDDPELTARALIACGTLSFYHADVARECFAEAIDLARASGDDWTLSMIFSYLAATSLIAGDPTAGRDAAEQGRDLADAVADGFVSRGSRVWLGVSLWVLGDLTHAEEVGQAVATDADTAEDLPMKAFAYTVYGFTLAHLGKVHAAHAAAQSARQASDAMGGVYGDAIYGLTAIAALAGGDAVGARRAAEEAFQYTVPERFLFTSSFTPAAEAALACGDLAVARRWADQAVSVVPGSHRVAALTTRAFVALAQGESEQAERDVYAALAIAETTRGHLRVPDAFECLARLAADGGNHP